MKPQALLEWLCALVVRPGTLVLDPFSGSGAIAEAVIRAGGMALAVDKQESQIRSIKIRFAGAFPS